MIYINGIGNISPQPSASGPDFLTDIRAYQKNMLQCIEPVYTDFLQPNALRRMSRVLKLGWAGAKTCLDDGGIQTPDSICIGTGKGCFQSTYIFLSSVNKNEERFVPPSPFIQSAHGSIASQIAIQTGCQNYNMTYAHRAFSFESALLDAMMLLQENKYKNVLLGGVDEIENIQFQTFDRIGHYKKPPIRNLDLLQNQSSGTIAGEGSAFFLLENESSDKTYAGISAVYTYSIPKNNKEVTDQIEDFLNRQNLNSSDLDLVMFGLNGDAEFDSIYHNLMNSTFQETKQTYYKHLCGEYHTSTAFALWISALIIHHQNIPEILQLNTTKPGSINNTLIYNQYRNRNHSLILLQNPNQW